MEKTTNDPQSLQILPQTKPTHSKLLQLMIDDTKAKRKADAKYRLYFDSKRSGNMLFRSFKVETQTTNPMCISGLISALKTNLPELGINTVITVENMELSINSGTI